MAWDKTKSVRGENFKMPGRKVLHPPSPVLQLHRRMTSEINIHEVIKLAMQIKNGHHDQKIQNILN